MNVVGAGGEGVHGDLNQRILVWLLQTHMVTVGVHSEGYLNANSPCEFYTLLRAVPLSYKGRGLEVRVCVCVCVRGVSWLQDVLFVSGCLVTQPALLWLLPAHLSSALLIVYLPNEGGGTLRHVIDSHVLLPSHCPALGFLAEMFSEGEGGWYFTYLCVFLVVLSLSPFPTSERIVGNTADAHASPWSFFLKTFSYM